MNPNLQRGLLLYEQSRFQQAEPEFRQAAAADPDDAYVRAMLALSLSHQERFDEAENEVKEALRADPGMSFVHYARALILNERDDYAGAETAVAEAIALEPGESSYRALHAQVLVNQRKWAEALTAAECGLEHDPEHVGCTNLRAIALVKLGRKEEAGQTIEAALARNPENSVTHANQGWTLLHSGEHKKALEHFCESLRLDPENEWARQGTVEALKARYFTYSLLLKYFLWMSRLSSQMQWGVIMGGYFGMRLLRGLSSARPELQPYLFPVQILYLIFVFLTWTAEPLFNLLLRLNRFGRLVLSEEERLASTCVGAFVGLSVLCLAGALADPRLLAGTAVFAFSVLPVAAVFKCPKGWPRRVMLGYTVAVVGAGLGAFASLMAMAEIETTRGSTHPTFGGLIGLFAVGIFLSSWIANFLVTRQVRR